MVTVVPKDGEQPDADLVGRFGSARHLDRKVLHERPSQASDALVEAYDAQYWSVFRDVDKHVRDALMSGLPHVYEAEMKHSEQGG